MKRLILTTCLVAFTTAGAVAVHAADENPGLALFKKGGCNECHSISALNVQKEAKKKAEGAKAEGATEPAATAPGTEAKKKKEPPDLSGVGLEHDAKWISAFLNKEERSTAKSMRSVSKARNRTAARWRCSWPV